MTQVDQRIPPLFITSMPSFAELEISYACTVGLALFLVMILTVFRLLFAGKRGLI